MKLLLWTVIVVLMVMWLMRGKKTTSSAPPRASGVRRDAIEPMLQCAHCGVHFPASEAVTTATGSFYCSDEHRVLHGAR